MRTTGDVGDTEALAAGVDELMNRIADRIRTDDPSRVAVLTALHLADKLRSLERRAAELEERARSLKLRGEHAERRVEELLEQARDNDPQPAAQKPRTDLRQRLMAIEERLACLLEDNDHQSSPGVPVQPHVDAG